MSASQNAFALVCSLQWKAIETRRGDSDGSDDDDDPPCFFCYPCRHTIISADRKVRDVRFREVSPSKRRVDGNVVSRGCSPRALPPRSRLPRVSPSTLHAPSSSVSGSSFSSSFSIGTVRSDLRTDATTLHGRRPGEFDRYERGKIAAPAERRTRSTLALERRRQRNATRRNAISQSSSHGKRGEMSSHANSARECATT